MFLTIYDTSRLCFSTNEQQKNIFPLYNADLFFIAIFSTCFPPNKWEALLLSGEELICFLFEVDTVVLFKAGCEGHFSLEYLLSV